MALQCCVGFCCTTTWISHHYTYILSLLNLTPNRHPITEHWVELPVLYSSFPQAVYWNKTPIWERLKAGGEGDDRGWDGCMASPTQWTWVWANSGRWWRTGEPGVLQSMGLQRVGHNWAAEQQQHVCWCYSINSSNPLLPFLCPQVHFLLLRLYLCPVFTSSSIPFF